MSDRVLIPLPGIGTLALDGDVYRAALAEGSKFSAAPSASGAATDEPLLDSDQLAAILNIPASWIEQKAREGVIPSLEFGRWRRFKRSDVESAVKTQRDR